jgi:hypothetical protein
VSTPREPGLDQLIRALTADGHPGERTGRDAALAAFRAASQPSSPASRRRDVAERTAWRHRGDRGRGAPWRRGKTWRRPLIVLVPARLAAVAAAGIAAIAAVTAAAYAQALPAPVQQIAHTVLAPLGVPDSRQQAARLGSPSHRTAPSPRPATSIPGTPATPYRAATCPCPSAAVSGSASPRTAGGYLLTLTASRDRLPADAVGVLTGRVTRHGRAAAGAHVRLLERTAGSARWEVAATGVTGPRGGFSFLSPRLTTTATFRVAGPDGARSATVRVTVGSPVRLRLSSGRVKDKLIVTARAALPGDSVLLDEFIAGAWTNIKSQPLGATFKATFTLPVSEAAAHDFRAELLIAGTSVPSDPVWVPRVKDPTGAKVIGGPSPTPSATAPSSTPASTPTAPPSPAPTPSPTPTLTSPAPTLTAPPPPTTTAPSPPSPTTAPSPTPTPPSPTSTQPSPTTSAPPSWEGSGGS